jgi:hypothetical protein
MQYIPPGAVGRQASPGAAHIPLVTSHASTIGGGDVSGGIGATAAQLWFPTTTGATVTD